MRGLLMRGLLMAAPVVGLLAVAALAEHYVDPPGPGNRRVGGAIDEGETLTGTVDIVANEFDGWVLRAADGTVVFIDNSEVPKHTTEHQSPLRTALNVAVAQGDNNNRIVFGREGDIAEFSTNGDIPLPEGG